VGPAIAFGTRTDRERERLRARARLGNLPDPLSLTGVDRPMHLCASASGCLQVEKMVNVFSHALLSIS
jgi:hypothetical protein